MQVDHIIQIKEKMVQPRPVAAHVSTSNHGAHTELPPDAAVQKASDARLLAKLKSALAEHNISLKFRKDDATNVLVVEMVDERTGEEIRQFPSEVSLKLAANFIKLQGHFIDSTK